MAAFIGVSICGVRLYSKKAAFPAVHIFVVQEEITVPPGEGYLTQWA